MAAGDILTYPQFRLGQLLNTTNIGDFDLTDGNVELAIMKNTWVPSTNFSTNQFLDDGATLATYQVATNTGYTGPITLTTPTAVLNASDLPEFRAADITIPLDASGFTDGRWWVVYYDSGLESTSALICYGDLGADKSIQTSSLQIDFSNVGDASNTLMRW